MFAMRPVAVAASCCAITGANFPDDVGYSDLYTDALEEIEDSVLDLQGEPIPDYLDGVYYQTGPAKWSFLHDHIKSPNAIAGAGKVHKWAFENGKVTFTTKFPQVDGNMMPNVNIWLMDKNELGVLTDAAIITMIDPKNLSFERNMMVHKNSSSIPTAASAHPHCAEDGSYVGLRETATGGMGVFKLHPSNPDIVQEVAHVKVPYASYTHSFGLTKGMEGVDYAAIVRQPVPVGIGLPWSQGEHDTVQSLPPLFGNSHVHLLPMDNGVSGKKPLTLELDRFFFGHFANTFSPGPGKVTFDLDRQQEIFFARFNMDVQQDKAKRDAWAEEHNDAYSTLTRYEVDLEKETVNQTKLFPDPATQCSYGVPSKWCEFDLFAFHPEDMGRSYCGFWSQQWFFNSSSFASWAIVRVEMCGPEGPRVVAHWYQRNAYPGEPQFVPRPGATDKTEGVIMFKTYEGDTGFSKFIILDAKTLRTKTTAVLPRRIPFTVHGKYYSKAQLEAGQCTPGQLEEKIIV